MRVERVEADLFVCVGDTYHSGTTVLVNGAEALLVDALGSDADARELKRFVEEDLGARVRLVVCTHYFSDHLAALRLFPESQIVAHRDYMHTFSSERYRTEEEEQFFVEPTMLFSEELTIRWGRFTLNLFHNPGHTRSTIGIEVPEADLLIAGDTIVGNMVYLGYATPDQFRPALERLGARRRGRFLTSHLGVRGPEAIDNARFYLETLGERVRSAREATADGSSILAIDLDGCLPPGVGPSDFEELFHRRNLEKIVASGYFAGS